MKTGRVYKATGKCRFGLPKKENGFPPLLGECAPQIFRNCSVNNKRTLNIVGIPYFNALSEKIFLFRGKSERVLEFFF